VFALAYAGGTHALHVPACAEGVLTMLVHVLLKVHEKEVSLKVVRFASREHVVKPAGQSQRVGRRTRPV
jgi:hypothetical protein